VTSSTPARILEVTSYPPPRAGWGVRVEFVKKRLEREGHVCTVLNTGPSRSIPSPEYDTVLGGSDFIRKVLRYSLKGFTVHAHANGDSVKGVMLALAAQLINVVCGRRPVLTFHAGAIQRHFPRERAGHLSTLFWLLFRIPAVIICNNQAVRERIQQYGVPLKKIAVIPAFTREYLEFTQTALPDHLERFLQQNPLVIFSYLRMRPLFYPLTMIEGLACLLKTRPDVGLVICGGLSHSEGDLWTAVQRSIEDHGLAARICFVDDLDHDAFLTALQRSTVYLRTPITDGVASSVLESLALGVPVVACENGTRPPHVLTYPPTDAQALAAQLDYVIGHRQDVVREMGQMELPDTLAAECALLATGAWQEPRGGLAG